MFKKLALGPMGLISALAGFILMFFVNLISRRGFVSSLMGGFIGMLGFSAAWCLIVGLLLTLFSSTEINNIFFNKKSALSEPEPTHYSLDDDEGELTAEDLYASDLSSFDEPPDSPLNSSVAADSSLADLLKSGKNKEGAQLGAGGRFDLKSGEKVLRTNAKEAALAARKVLMNDRL